ncbi:DUF3341 domain-containing protein [Dyella sp.]|jgi:hypothetical protein|uniref:DUF3341 domain-containing protein n=1 Tax=Dyella sp. TaxID=1869338 RepID=UPI002D78E25B|nr:DUF3341 domain-containing protein [Dyella sp.]HET6432791.1 DUF3341 domain-containing protein [Dyella sp.]
MSRADASGQGTYGWMAAFHDAPALVEAVRRLHGAGARAIEVHTPFALPELEGLLPPPRWPRVVPWAALLGGVCGGGGTLALQYYSAVIDYPIRVGGRPYASWPAFIPAALEMTLLFIAGFAVLAMLIVNRLPRLYHPLFHARAAELATQDAYLVLVRSDDRCCERALLNDLLSDLAPFATVEVPR